MRFHEYQQQRGVNELGALHWKVNGRERIIITHTYYKNKSSRLPEGLRREESLVVGRSMGMDLLQCCGLTICGKSSKRALIT